MSELAEAVVLAMLDAVEAGGDGELTEEARARVEAIGSLSGEELAEIAGGEPEEDEHDGDKAGGGPVGKKLAEIRARRGGARVTRVVSKRVRPVRKKVQKGEFLAFDEENNEATFVLTTSTTDRDGETVNPTGGNFKEYQNNPVVCFNHNVDELPVGRCVKLWNADVGEGTEFEQVPGPKRAALLGTVRFSRANPKGRVIAGMVKDGDLRGCSISFLPEGAVGKNKQGGNHYENWKMLEWSVCPIGSNPDAVRLSLQVIKRLKAVSKGAERTVEIHGITRAPYRVRLYEKPDGKFYWSSRAWHNGKEYGPFSSELDAHKDAWKLIKHEKSVVRPRAKSPRVIRNQAGLDAEIRREYKPDDQAQLEALRAVILRGDHPEYGEDWDRYLGQVDAWAGMDDSTWRRVTGQKRHRSRNMKRKMWVNGKSARLLKSEGPLDDEIKEYLKERDLDDVRLDDSPPQGDGWEEEELTEGEDVDTLAETVAELATTLAETAESLEAAVDEAAGDTEGVTPEVTDEVVQVALKKLKAKGVKAGKSRRKPKRKAVEKAEWGVRPHGYESGQWVVTGPGGTYGQFASKQEAERVLAEEKRKYEERERMSKDVDVDAAAEEIADLAGEEEVEVGDDVTVDGEQGTVVAVDAGTASVDLDADGASDVEVPVEEVAVEAVAVEAAEEVKALAVKKLKARRRSKAVAKARARRKPKRKAEGDPDAPAEDDALSGSGPPGKKVLQTVINAVKDNLKDLEQPQVVACLERCQEMCESTMGKVYGGGSKEVKRRRVRKAPGDLEVDSGDVDLPDEETSQYTVREEEDGSGWAVVAHGGVVAGPFDSREEAQTQADRMREAENDPEGGEKRLVSKKLSKATASVVQEAVDFLDDAAGATDTPKRLKGGMHYHASGLKALLESKAPAPAEEVEETELDEEALDSIHKTINEFNNGLSSLSETAFRATGRRF